MRRLMTTGVFVLVTATAWAQGQAPNRRDVVEAVSAADPARFACAHVEGRGCKTDWIKAVAAALHATDARWGLNGKRGNPNDISMDVVTFRIGPTDRHVQAFDICGACGGGSPSVVWNDITNWATIGQPGTAIWIKPDGVAPPTGPPPVVPPPVTPAVDLRPVLDALAALTAKVDALAAKPAPVLDLSDVSARVDAVSAQVDQARQEIQALSAKPITVEWPEYSGRVLGSPVTLRPKR